METSSGGQSGFSSSSGHEAFSQMSLGSKTFHMSLTWEIFFCMIFDPLLIHKQSDRKPVQRFQNRCNGIVLPGFGQDPRASVLNIMKLSWIDWYMHLLSKKLVKSLVVVYYLVQNIKSLLQHALRHKYNEMHLQCVLCVVWSPDARLNMWLALVITRSPGRTTG